MSFHNLARSNVRKSETSAGQKTEADHRHRKGFTAVCGTRPGPALEALRSLRKSSIILAICIPRQTTNHFSVGNSNARRNSCRSASGMRNARLDQRPLFPSLRRRGRPFDQNPMLAKFLNDLLGVFLRFPCHGLGCTHDYVQIGKLGYLHWVMVVRSL